ncbi:MAG: hypothetical protein P8046_14055 [Anaerolineales bacterium]
MAERNIPPVMELRVAITTEDFERLKKFYCDGLGMEPAQIWNNNGGKALMLELGKANLEIEPAVGEWGGIGASPCGHALGRPERAPAGPGRDASYFVPEPRGDGLSISMMKKSEAMRPRFLVLVGM